ncbi:CPBP family intramembrane metalloprotease [Cryobacterium lactosi]|uniref:CPBP family intramembrane metalloprotease n=1 Tax=Cryobacterium lactosi TaxID=1259202 RepID=A0A4R9BXQ6_9MICO|nr:CPBP family intramembrane glutamic endopeptidase [Cryobacterium lactosi]TFD93031.1 CPBP family intramembrane metalloprotease [Cryobacterium lactosi]
MRKLQDTKPIWHALIWIAIYILAVNIGDLLGEVLQFPELTSIVLVALSIILIVYLRRSGRLAFYGIRSVQPGTLPLTLWYVPLFAITFVQYAKGFAPGLDLTTIVFAILLVTAVGFIEELLFRGFLLEALRTRGNLTRAILISGITFGMGHIVNLLRGYSLPDQAVQLVAAVLIGIALAYCVVLTGSILPGVVFHALFNLSGTLTIHSAVWDSVAVGAIAIIMIGFIVLLHKRLEKVRSAPLESAVGSHRGA